jgi:hypothetical protein
MALPACQERILHGMETALRTHEPRLAAIFAIFTRLTKDEEIPYIERLAPQRWLSWRRPHRTARGGRAPGRQRQAGSTTGRAGQATGQPWSWLAHIQLVPMLVLLIWAVVISICISVSLSGYA